MLWSHVCVRLGRPSSEPMRRAHAHAKLMGVRDMMLRFVWEELGNCGRSLSAFLCLSTVESYDQAMYISNATQGQWQEVADKQLLPRLMLVSLAIVACELQTIPELGGFLSKIGGTISCGRPHKPYLAMTFVHSIASWSRHVALGVCAP